MKNIILLVLTITFFIGCGKLTKEQCAKKGHTWVKYKTVDKQTNKFIYTGYCEKKSVDGYVK